MSRPEHAFHRRFRHAAGQVRAAFNDYRASGGNEAPFLDLLHRRTGDSTAVHIVSFLQEMAAQGGPVPERWVKEHLTRMFPGHNVPAALQALLVVALVEQRAAPADSYFVHYVVNDDFYEAFEDHTAARRSSEADLVEQVTRQLHRFEDERKKQEWLTTTFSEKTEGRSAAEIETLGAVIDQATDSFNEILNLLGPPPEPSDDETAVPPTVPAGVS